MFEQYDDVVTVPELCQMLRIGRSAAYKLVNTNIITSINVGRNKRIPKQAVIAYVSGQRQVNEDC